MRWVELNDVEYGECIVLGGKRGIFMVDCGSVNHKLKPSGESIDECFAAIAHRYEIFRDRDFLLTHYHKDHLNGFLKIIKEDPLFFTRVFLPALPIDEQGNSIFLTFALYAHLFLPYQTDCALYNTSCLKLIQTVTDAIGSDRLYMLNSDQSFVFDHVNYEVLWPPAHDFPYRQELIEAADALDILYASPFLSHFEREFHAKKRRFIEAYHTCCQSFSLNQRASTKIRQLATQELVALYHDLNGLKECLNQSAKAHDVREILNQPIIAQAFSDTANDLSIVFHNQRDGLPGLQDILMTGDAPPWVMEEISAELYDGYYLLKAPHHGTASGYCDYFAEMSFSHILISNGDYHCGGAISDAYVEMENSICHCTGNAACKWQHAAGSCCNRLKACYELRNSALTLRCKAALGKSRAPDCMIRCVSLNKERGCFCE